MPKLDACFFCEETPEIHLKDGLFHVVFFVGDGRFEFVMPASTYLRAERQSHERVAEFRKSDNVVALANH